MTDDARASSKSKIIVAMAGNGEMTATEIKLKAGLMWWEPCWLYLMSLQQDGVVTSRVTDWPWGIRYRLYRLK